MPDYDYVHKKVLNLYDCCDIILNDKVEVEFLTSSYNKLRKLLIDKMFSKVNLCKNADIAPNTMIELRCDEPVSMSILLKKAEYLECDISNMCEFVKEGK